MSKDEDLAACLAMRRHLAEDPKASSSRLAVERLSDGFGERIRVMPMIEVLLRRNTITDRQALAGQRIFADYMLGIVGVSGAEPTGNGSDPDGYAVAQAHAASEYRRVRDHVGPRLWPITFACVIEDFSPFRWANERGHAMHKRAAVELLRVALDSAADALAID
jgi:hypothetical protein